MKYQFVHFFMNNSSVFNNAVQDIIQQQEYADKHMFVYRYPDYYYNVSDRDNTILDAALGEYEAFDKYLKIGSYIVIHQLLYDNKTLSRLSEEQAGRVVWCVWGGDLYDIQQSKTILYRLIRKIYRFVLGKEKYKKRAEKNISKFRGIAIGFEGDEIELKNRFGSNINLYSALYPMGYYLNDVDRWNDDLGVVSGTDTSNVHILIGHSAYSMLQHDKYLNKFEKYREKVILHLPLSYGNTEYADRIEKKALAMYGEERIQIYRDMMKSEEYFKILKQIDVAVFDYEHQAAFGNIIILLYLNKKIFLSPSGVMYKGLKSLGLQVYDVNEINTYTSLEQLKACDYFEENRRYAAEKLDKDILVNKWSEMFMSIENGG